MSPVYYIHPDGYLRRVGSSSPGSSWSDQFLPPQIIATTSAVNQSASSITLNTPSGAQSGDLLVAHISSALFASATDATPPSGWTRVGPAFVASTTSNRVTGWWQRTVTGSEPTTHTFTFSGANRVVGAVSLIRSTAGTPVVVGSSSTIPGLVSSDGHSALPATTSKGFLGNLVLLGHTGEHTAGSSHTVTTIPAGFTQAASVVSTTDTAQTRTTLWMGSRQQNDGGGSGSSALQHSGSVTDGRTSQVILTSPITSRTTSSLSQNWTRVVHEDWSTPVALGGWSSSVYQSRYPTATDGEGDTKWNNTGGVTGGQYNRSQLYVENGYLKIRVNTVGGVPLGGKVILNGWGGHLGIAAEGTIKASAAPGFKALVIGWKADPYVWADGEIDCGEADLNGSDLPNGYVYHGASGQSLWSGWSALSSSPLSDGVEHQWRFESHPTTGVRFWWDNTFVGTASGGPITVPMWVGFQVETANLGANPDASVDSHVAFGPVDVWHLS